jgi:hypothetical protein
MSVPERTQVFISYSHQDRRWLQRLQTMLAPLTRNHAIMVWDDSRIKAGSKWQEEIQKALATAKVAVLLVSPHFLASEFIANHELPPLLKAAEEEGLTILWIAVSNSLYTATTIADFQAANNPAKPLMSLRAQQVDAELTKIAKKIQAAVSQPITLPQAISKERHPTRGKKQHTTAKDIEQTPETGRPRPPGRAHHFEGYWQSRWTYGDEACCDLLELEQIDSTRGTVLGRRTAKVGGYSYNYEVSGHLIGVNIYLIARSCSSFVPIGAVLVLKARDHFNNQLTGLAIRPAGNAAPNPLMDDTLFHDLDFWASRVIYERVGDPRSCGELWTAHCDFPMAYEPSPSLRGRVP